MLSKQTPWRLLAVFCIALPTFAADPQLPWRREIPLREVARSVYLTYTLVSMVGDCQRPHGLGYLLKKGRMHDPYRNPIEYRFPCQKPVGQIIIGMDDLAGATPPEASQSCANGVVKLEPSDAVRHQATQ